MFCHQGIKEQRDLVNDNRPIVSLYLGGILLTRAFSDTSFWVLTFHICHGCAKIEVEYISVGGQQRWN